MYDARQALQRYIQDVDRKKRQAAASRPPRQTLASEPAGSTLATQDPGVPAAGAADSALMDRLRRMGEGGGKAPIQNSDELKRRAYESLPGIIRTPLQLVEGGKDLAKNVMTTPIMLGRGAYDQESWQEKMYSLGADRWSESDNAFLRSMGEQDREKTATAKANREAVQSFLEENVMQPAEKYIENASWLRENKPLAETKPEFWDRITQGDIREAGQSFVEDFARNTLPMIASLAGTAATGNPVVGGGIMGAHIGGGQYRENVSVDSTPEERMRALQGSVVNAAVQGALEQYGISKILKAPGGKGWAGKLWGLGVAVGSEAGTEMLQEIPEALSQEWIENPDRSFEEHLVASVDTVWSREMAKNMVYAGMLGGALGGTMHTGVGGIRSLAGRGQQEGSGDQGQNEGGATAPGGPRQVEAAVREAVLEDANSDRLQELPTRDLSAVMVDVKYLREADPEDGEIAAAEQGIEAELLRRQQMPEALRRTEDELATRKAAKAQSRAEQGGVDKRTEVQRLNEALKAQAQAPEAVQSETEQAPAQNLLSPEEQEQAKLLDRRISTLEQLETRNPKQEENLTRFREERSALDALAEQRATEQAAAAQEAPEGDTGLPGAAEGVEAAPSAQDQQDAGQGVAPEVAEQEQAPSTYETPRTREIRQKYAGRNEGLEHITDRVRARESLYEDVADEQKKEKLRRRLSDRVLGEHEVVQMQDAEDAIRELDTEGVPYVVERTDGGNMKGLNTFYKDDHARADEDLREVWGNIYAQEVRRHGGIISRDQGDEFLVVWPNFSRDEVTEIRDDIEEQIRNRTREMGIDQVPHGRHNLPTGALYTNYGLVEGRPGAMREVGKEADLLQGLMKREYEDSRAQELGYIWNEEAGSYEYRGLEQEAGAAQGRGADSATGILGVQRNDRGNQRKSQEDLGELPEDNDQLPSEGRESAAPAAEEVEAQPTVAPERQTEIVQSLPDNILPLAAEAEAGSSIPLTAFPDEHAGLLREAGLVRISETTDPESGEAVTAETVDADVLREEQARRQQSEQPKFRAAAQQDPGVQVKDAETAVAPLREGLADDVNLQVVQSVADLPTDLQRAMRDKGGENAPGVHWKGASYIVADNLRSEHDVVFSAAHELLHQGRERLVEQMAAKSGDVRKAANKVENALDQVWSARQNDIRRMVGKSGQYEGMFDLSKKAERRLAAEEWLAEHGIKDAPKWYDRYVAAIRQMFRAIGEHLGVRMEFSDTEIRALVNRMAEANRKPLPEDRTDTPVFVPAPQYQQEQPERTYSPGNEPNVLLAGDEFRKQLKAAREGNLESHKVLELGSTPRVLQALGAPDLPVTMAQNVVEKATGGKHTLDADTLGQIVEAINDPIMVFDSTDGRGNFVVMTELVDNDGKTVVAAVHVERKQERHAVNAVASVYGKDRDTVFRKWVGDGLARYQNKKKRLDWERIRGLQLPKIGPNQGNKKILTESDIVNQGASKFRMPNSEEQGEALGFLRNIQKGLRSGSLKLPEHEVSPIAMQRRLREIVGRSDEFDMQQFIWSGVNDWLTDRKTSVSRDDVLRYMADQTVRVQKDHILSLAFQVGRNLEGGASIDQKAMDRVIGSKVALDAFLEENVPGASPSEKARVLRKIAANETESQREKAALRAMAKLIEGETPKKHKPKPAPEKPRLADVPRDKQGNPIQRTPEELDASIESKIGAPEVPLSDRFREYYEAVRERGWDEVTQGTVDMFHALELVDKAYEEANSEEFAGLSKVEKKVGSAYINARQAQAPGDMLHAMILHGRPKWHERGGAVVETKSDGLLSIFEPISKAGGNQEVDQFLRWVVGERAAKLRSEEREALFDEEEIARMRGYKTPEVAQRWEDAHEKLDDFRQDVIKYGMDAGIISSEARELLNDQFYVPFYRVLDERKGGPRNARGLTNQKGIQRLHGSERNIIDPLESLTENFTKLIDAANKNRASRIALNKAVQLGLARPVENQIEFRTASAETFDRSLRNALGESTSLLNLTQEEKANLGAIFLPKPPEGDNVVRVMWDGKPQYYEIDDPLLYRSLTSINMQKGEELLRNLSLGPLQLGKWARGSKRLLTAGVTMAPGFRIFRNPFRDTVHSLAAAPSEQGLRPFTDAFSGAKKIWTEDQMYVQALAGGGLFMGGYDVTRGSEEAAKDIRSRLKEMGIDHNTVLDTPRKLARFYEKLGQAGENMNRMAVYEKVLRETGSPLLAAYEARDLMDFSKRGDWTAMQVITATVPFFNARLQGLVRLGRSAKEPHMRTRLLTVGSTIALASALLHLHNDGDDEYKELPEWERDTYWHIKVNGQWLRFPKPFEVGAVFATVPERITEAFVSGVMNDDPDAGRRLQARLWWNLKETFNLNPLQVQLIWPAAEAASNWDSFRGAPIVSEYDKRLPKDQYDARTSDTMVALGKITGNSPKKLEHLFRGYLGTMGDYTLGVTDLLAERLMEAPEEPAKAFHETTLGKAFILGDIYRGSEKDVPWSSRYVSEMYDLYREVDEVYMSARYYQKMGHTEKARELAEENKSKLAQRGPLKDAYQAVADINAELRKIEQSTALSAKEKRTRMDELRKRKFEIAKRGVQRARGLEKAEE